MELGQSRNLFVEDFLLELAVPKQPPVQLLHSFLLRSCLQVQAWLRPHYWVQSQPGVVQQSGYIHLQRGSLC